MTSAADAPDQRIDAHELKSAEWDRESVDTGGSIRYIVLCTTPRTAGHTLCRYMLANGWGVPAEYFGPTLAMPLLGRWTGQAVATLDEVRSQLPLYASHLVAKRCRNAIFSLKLLPYHFRFFQPAFGPVANAANTRFVYLHRQDKAEQTISSAALRLTQRPSFSNIQTPYIAKLERLDENAILHIYKYLCLQDYLWCEFLVKSRVDYCTISTEDLVEDGERVVVQLAADLGLDLDPSATKQCAEAERGARYTVDAELKAAMRKKFGPFLAKLQKESPGLPFGAWTR